MSEMDCSEISKPISTEDIEDDDLGGKLWEMIQAEKYDDAESEIQKHDEFILSNCMDLIPVLTLKLMECTEEKSMNCIGNLLEHISEVARPKEAVMVLLEDMRVLKSVDHLSIILRALKVALSRTMSEYANLTLFSWTFDSIYDSISKMELPIAYNLEGKERHLLDADPSVVALSTYLSYILDFLRHFYKLILLGNLKFSKKTPNPKDFFAHTTLIFFDKPLTYLDLYKRDDDVESSVYWTTQKLVEIVVKLVKNPLKLLDFASQNISHNEENSEGKRKMSQKSLATFFYCIYSQNMCIDRVPLVYSSEYKFFSCLPLMCQLLSLTEHLVLHKGLLLAKSLIDLNDDLTFSLTTLDVPCHGKFNELMVNCMTMVDNKELRLLAFSVFRKYISCFDYEGKYRLFENLLNFVSHAGLSGFIITELKQNIHLALKRNDGSKFVHSSVWNLVYFCCTLPDGERTDMLDWSDKILASLNLILFLFLRTTSGKQNANSHALLRLEDVVIHVGHLEENFLTPLRRGLQLSIEHYKLKEKDLKENKSRENTNFEVNVADSILPGLDPEQELDVVSLALSRFDMIKCVLAQVDSSAQEINQLCSK